MLGTGDYGNEIQDDLNAIVSYDEKFNNAFVRHSLGLKDEAIFRYPNPINFTFHDLKKFDLVNSVIGKLATHVKASKLTDYQFTKKILQQGEIDELQLRLDKLKYGAKKDDDDENTRPPGGGRGSGGMPGPGPSRTPQQEMDEITRRLDYLRGNTPDVSPYNTREQILKLLRERIMKNLLINKLNKDKEKFQICQKELLIKENRA